VLFGGGGGGESAGNSDVSDKGMRANLNKRPAKKSMAQFLTAERTATARVGVLSPGMGAVVQEETIAGIERG
jgi:hypothetical protein